MNAKKRQYIPQGRDMRDVLASEVRQRLQNREYVVAGMFIFCVVGYGILLLPLTVPFWLLGRIAALFCRE